ncbi:PfkB family carbohydrate kinase [Polaromonas sp.]|uniref:PfkB family carbohydrate kinase n=1 Tax=Polaromonas sp. TaxID=1869339 RepID=UPI00352A0271
MNLHSYFTQKSAKWFEGAYGLYSNLAVRITPVDESLGFRYVHDSSNPDISPSPLPCEEPIRLAAQKVVRFGMLEGDAIVDADMAVYDPQSPNGPVPFSENGSKARRLAIVLNSSEAKLLAKTSTESVEDCARTIAHLEGAEVVIIKQGPLGAFVWDQGKSELIPAYLTSTVWKIGSGDCFVAHFAYGWMAKGESAAAAAAKASKATAYYCQYQALPAPVQLDGFNPEPLLPSAAYLNGGNRHLYLAGPFFDLPQIWMIEEALRNLRELGFKVFSPFHDVGMGSAKDIAHQDLKALDKSDIVFAIADGVDAGTMFEVGYARAKKIPVIVYSERESEENLKMPEGTDCTICDNYTTALYKTLWKAMSL